jgi:transcriptional regulator with XRE-family HTH domain
MIGTKLKELRTAKKLTQAELAGRIGIDRSMIAKVEAGKNINPTLSVLQKIANELGASIEVLCGSDEQ